MGLMIISAKNIKEARDKAISAKAKEASVVENEGLGDFFFSYKSYLSNYQIYYKLEPYGISKVDNKDLLLLKDFADSLIDFVENHQDLENQSIGQFNISFSQVIRYAEKLKNLCQYALANNEDLIGLGD